MADSQWYEIDATWDLHGYASDKLMALGESPQWLSLVNEASQNTHATAEEVWDGMAAALRRYLESLDNLVALGRAYTFTTDKGNPYFCPECDVNRRQRISAQFATIMEEFDKLKDKKNG